MGNFVNVHVHVDVHIMNVWSSTRGGKRLRILGLRAGGLDEGRLGVEIEIGIGIGEGGGGGGFLEASAIGLEWIDDFDCQRAG